MHSERRWANHKLTRQAWRCGSEGSWAYRRSLQTSRYKEESSEVHRWFTACMTCVVAHEAGGDQLERVSYWRQSHVRGLTALGTLLRLPEV